jgi:hypothetical protein
MFIENLLYLTTIWVIVGLHGINSTSSIYLWYQLLIWGSSWIIVGHRVFYKYPSITIKNLWIEQWNQLDKSSQISIFKGFTDKNGNQVKIGNQFRDRKGLAIVNYTIGNTQVSQVANNWQDINIGRLNFDANLWDNWDAY